MALYNFTLTLSGVSYETEGLEDALYQNGCDDALICAYGNSVYVEFLTAKHNHLMQLSHLRSTILNQPVSVQLLNPSTRLLWA